MFNFITQHSPLFYFTQSIWRDEAYSLLVAQRPVTSIIGTLGFEPPLYYILLHFWVKLFGTGEIAARALSLLGFTLATVVVIHWSKTLFKKHWLAWFAPLFFFLNPMLLYYAFEIRAYGWYMLFAILCMYTYWRRRWTWFILASVLGFYTHTYMLFLPLAIGTHYLITHRRLLSPKHLRLWVNDPLIRSLLAVGILCLPWVVKIAQESAKLKQSWYFPVDLHLIKSVLGNMFIGYEGTPWFLWKYTAALSLVITTAGATAILHRVNRNRNFFFLLVTYMPLAIVIGVSFFKPLFVNRYLIYVTMAEVFVIVAAIEAIRHTYLQTAAAILSLAVIVGINAWYPTKHQKVNIRNTLRQINTLKSNRDVILAESPLIFFETLYYSKDPARTYLYNPAQSPFPWYVGDSVFSADKMVDRLPMYPVRAFIVRQNGTFDITYAMPTVVAPEDKTARKK